MFEYRHETGTGSESRSETTNGFQSILLTPNPRDGDPQLAEWSLIRNQILQIRIGMRIPRSALRIGRMAMAMAMARARLDGPLERLVLVRCQRPLRLGYL